MTPVSQVRKPLSSTRGAILMASGDIFAMLLSFWLSMSFFTYLFDIDLGVTLSSFNYISPFERPYLYMAIGSAVVLLIFSHGHYTQRIPWWNQIRLLTVAILFAMLAEGFATFVLKIRSNGPLIIFNWALCYLFIIWMRLIFFKIRAVSSSRWKVPTVLIGDASTVTDILYAFNADPSIGYDLRTVIIQGDEHFDRDDLPKKYAQLKVERNIEDYESYVTNHPHDFYVIVMDIFRGTSRDKMIETLNKINARFAVVPSTSRISLYEMEPRYFFGYDVMLLHAKPSLSNTTSRFMKRTVDIFASLSGLLVLSPLFLTMIAFLKLEKHQGSIFYGGERVGKNGKLFKCWKFRTMAPNTDHLLHDLLERDPAAKAHWEKYLKLPNDPRVQTKTANFLRKVSMDEMPQLWNVLKGDMSLVGPRPILPKEADIYGDTIKDYIKVRPGITGLWQVSGRNAMSFQRRVYWDSWYVRNWSLWGDIVIILKTVPAVLLRNDGH